MPGKPDKKSRIRVKTIDGKPRDQSAINKLRSIQLGMTYLDFVGTDVGHEFIICAPKDAHIEQVRAKLQAAGLEAIDGGDTAIAPSAPVQQQAPQGRHPQQRSGAYQRGAEQRGAHGRGAHHGPANHAEPLQGKPYGFVSLPSSLKTEAPIWHDGTSSRRLLSGEVRFELEALTPLLVGWERGQVGDNETDWPVPASLAGAQLPSKKSVLCPLRAPWGKRPVIIPGDSLKGLLRHELGALLGAPMERVAERSYSYRPNATYPSKNPNSRFLVPRLARVLDGRVATMPLDETCQVRVPTHLELFPPTLEYNKREGRFDYRFDRHGGATYRGGQGAGQRLNSRPEVHTSLAVLKSAQTEIIDVPGSVRDGFLATVRHLVDLDHGHFSERHPDVPGRNSKPRSIDGEVAKARILTAATREIFQSGDLVWVEWDTEKKRIVSLGWHYYYRWAYTDSVRKDADAPRLERHGLFPLARERETDRYGAPEELSAVRRLFGYTGDNEGSAGIGENDHAQLMSRVFVNAGLEVVGDNESEEQRFLRPTFLKELGMPRPSAVEHYLKQPHHPRRRPSDNATLVTYGDAAGYDAPGELAGRKFYFDRSNAVAEDASEANTKNDRSTLALEASAPGRRFRFTVRFRDLEAAELAAVVVAFSPDQFSAALGGTHKDGYCSKLGYARPLGWGSVRIEAKQLLWLDETGESPILKADADLSAWVNGHHARTVPQDEWLAIHRRNHPDAAGYPKEEDRDGNENIYTYHTRLRSTHSLYRRYR